MKKWGHIAITILSMLIVSRFLIRIFDATGQINEHFWMLSIAMLLVNAFICYIGYRIYKNKKNLK